MANVLMVFTNELSAINRYCYSFDTDAYFTSTFLKLVSFPLKVKKKLKRKGHTLIKLDSGTSAGLGDTER